MKRAGFSLIGIAVLAVLIFVAVIIFAPTETMRWQAFSICLPGGFVSFLAGVICLVIEYTYGKKK